jgi:hypothetical protein
MSQSAQSVYDKAAIVEANEHRKKLKAIAADVLDMKNGLKEPEAIANVMLTYRHLEDASMRLGKVIQALDGGASVYDRATGFGAGLVVLAAPAIIRIPKLLMPIKILTWQPELVLAKTYLEIPRGVDASLVLESIGHTDWQYDREDNGTFSRVYLTERNVEMPLPWHLGIRARTDWQGEDSSTGWSNLKLSGVA